MPKRNNRSRNWQTVIRKREDVAEFNDNWMIKQVFLLCISHL